MFPPSFLSHKTWITPCERLHLHVSKSYSHRCVENIRRNPLPLKIAGQNSFLPCLNRNLFFRLHNGLLFSSSNQSSNGWKNAEAYKVSSSYGKPKVSLSGRSSLQVCHLSLRGNSFEYEESCITRSSFAHLMGISFRDVCMADPGNHDHNPVVLVRDKTIILRLGEVNALLRHNEIWLFQPKSLVVRSVIKSLKDSIYPGDLLFRRASTFDGKKGVVADLQDAGSTGNEDTEDFFLTNQVENGSIPRCSSNFPLEELSGESSKSSFSQTTGGNQWPFEFRCIEVCMEASIKDYEGKVDALSNEFEKNIKFYEGIKRKEGIGAIYRDNLLQIMKIKNELQALDTLISSLTSSLSRILNEDEDMAALYLTSAANNQPHEVSDHSEAEILLETYLQQFEDLHSEVVTARQRIMHYEQLTKLELDMRRNQFIEMNARIALFSLSCSISAVVAGVFGMNLKNRWEENDYAFFVVCGGLIIPTGALGLVTYGRFVRYFCRP